MIYWIARIVAALIMFQTLFFKFTGELIASILLLINPFAWVGAAIGAGLMIGAIGMHVFLLGIVVGEDRGQLFIYAVTVLVCCLYILVVNREKITAILRSKF
jgi:putative oxidoreductase